MKKSGMENLVLWSTLAAVALTAPIASFGDDHHRRGNNRDRGRDRDRGRAPVVIVTPAPRRAPVVVVTPPARHRAPVVIVQPRRGYQPRAVYRPRVVIDLRPGRVFVRPSFRPLIIQPHYWNTYRFGYGAGYNMIYAPGCGWGWATGWYNGRSRISIRLGNGSICYADPFATGFQEAHSGYIHPGARVHHAEYGTGFVSNVDFRAPDLFDVQFDQAGYTRGIRGSDLFRLDIDGRLNGRSVGQLVVNPISGQQARITEIYDDGFITIQDLVATPGQPATEVVHNEEVCLAGSQNCLLGSLSAPSDSPLNQGAGVTNASVKSESAIIARDIAPASTSSQSAL